MVSPSVCAHLVRAHRLSFGTLFSLSVSLSLFFFFLSPRKKLRCKSLYSMGISSCNAKIHLRRISSERKWVHITFNQSTYHFQSVLPANLIVLPLSGQPKWGIANHASTWLAPMAVQSCSLPLAWSTHLSPSHAHTCTLLCTFCPRMCIQTKPDMQTHLGRQRQRRPAESRWTFVKSAWFL